MDKLSLIHQYELGYLSQADFYDYVLGSGQQLIAQEGLERYIFYLQCEANQTQNKYFIEFYKREGFRFHKVIVGCILIVPTINPQIYKFILLEHQRKRPSKMRGLFCCLFFYSSNSL